MLGHFACFYRCKFLLKYPPPIKPIAPPVSYLCRFKERSYTHVISTIILINGLAQMVLVVLPYTLQSVIQLATYLQAHICLLYTSLALL